FRHLPEWAGELIGPQVPRHGAGETVFVRREVRGEVGASAADRYRRNAAELQVVVGDASELRVIGGLSAGPGRAAIGREGNRGRRCAERRVVVAVERAIADIILELVAGVRGLAAVIAETRNRIRVVLIRVVARVVPELNIGGVGNSREV